MGMGNDQYGQDYTKAAGRAIEDAFRHSAIPMFQALEPTLGLTPQEMRVQVNNLIMSIELSPAWKEIRI